jgi:uncharacterized protein (TIGR02246 family)
MVLGLALALASCNRASTPAPATESIIDRAAITRSIDSLQTALVSAVTARDSVRILESYADDAKMFTPGIPRADGREAIRKVWTQFLAIPDVTLGIQSSEVIPSEKGDLVINMGTYRTTMKGKDGKEVEDLGKYVTVFKRVNGQWKTYVDIYNSDKSP